jgi:hypothetical protein
MPSHLSSLQSTRQHHSKLKYYRLRHQHVTSQIIPMAPSRRRLNYFNLRSIKLRKPVAMAASGTPVKRSSSSVPHNNPKRLRHYHHHHRLQEPVTLPSSEPAVQDEAHVDQLMNRAIGMSLKDAGFNLAEPTALSSFRSATEECT